jgi:zinc protease
MRRFLYGFVALGLMLAPACQEAAAVEATRTVLDSGLTVLHAERSHLPFVVISLLVKAGARHDPPGRAGLASLSASLMREGTERRSAEEINEELEFIGAGLGASASQDYSSLSLSVLKRHLAKGFDIFADVLLHPTFPEEEVQRLKEQSIASLIRSEEDPGFLARRAFARQVFGAHPYGMITTVETTKAINREHATGFYATYYRPNNAILSVVGDISTEELKALLDTYLGGWQARDIPAEKPVPVPSPAPMRITIDKDLTQATIMLGHRGVRREHPDYYALSLMNYILGGGGFSSRLMESVREEQGLAYSIWSSFRSWKEAGDFRVSVQTKNQSAETVVEEILRQMRLIMKERVSDRELEDAKSYMIGSFPRRIETMGKIASFLAAVEFHGLGLDYPEKYREYIASITREDVKRVAEEYLKTENYVLVVVARLSETDLPGRE